MLSFLQMTGYFNKDTNSQTTAKEKKKKTTGACTPLKCCLEFILRFRDTAGVQLLITASRVWSLRDTERVGGEENRGWVTAVYLLTQEEKSMV